MFDTVLVADRGEIARRVLRTCRRLEVRTVAVHSEADTGALHVREADEAVLLGAAPAAASYLDAVKVIEAARATGAQAVHPGYGFLAEDPAFARAVLDAGLAWVGPPPAAMELMADDVAARAAAQAAGVPVPPGRPDPLHGVDAAVAAAEELGYPLVVRAAAGGGGTGLGVAHDEADLRAAFAVARDRAERFSGSPAVLLERSLPAARHVEVQVLGLADDRVVALGERDCSVQRRCQKLAAESPSPGVDEALRARLRDAAVRLAASVAYRGAGTVEFLVAGGDFVFLEMNTRLQVEHPVTELVTGVDLVEEQLRVAAGEPPGFDPDAVVARGSAVELRVHAEDPVRFLLGAGTIVRWEEPSGEGIRVDAGYTEGDVVTPHYDPLLATLCAYGADRDEALRRLREAVGGFVVEGPAVNLPFLVELLAEEEFTSGAYDTGLVARMTERRRARP